MAIMSQTSDAEKLYHLTAICYSSFLHHEDEAKANSRGIQFNPPTSDII